MAASPANFFQFIPADRNGGTADLKGIPQAWGLFISPLIAAVTRIVLLS